MIPGGLDILNQIRTDAQEGGRTRSVLDSRVVEASAYAARQEVTAVQDADQRQLALDHVRRLQQADRIVMVQPYLTEVDTEGETSLVYLGGVFSHAMRKGAVLDGPDTGIDRRFQHDGGLHLQPRQPTSAQFALAEQVLAAVPGGRERLLYARIDLLPSADGTPVLIELELTEPQLYLGKVPGAADRLVTAITAVAVF